MRDVKGDLWFRGRATSPSCAGLSAHCRDVAMSRFSRRFPRQTGCHLARCCFSCTSAVSSAAVRRPGCTGGARGRPLNAHDGWRASPCSPLGAGRAPIHAADGDLRAALPWTRGRESRYGGVPLDEPDQCGDFVYRTCLLRGPAASTATANARPRVGRLSETLSRPPTRRPGGGRAALMPRYMYRIIDR